MRTLRRFGCPRERQAFTLIELIVVIAVIGILAAAVVVNTSGVRQSAEEVRLQADMQAILDAANMIHAFTGRYPESIQEMVEARDENGKKLPGFTDEPLDPWGNPYVYEVVDGEPRVMSLGRDKAEGGEGPDADIVRPKGREG